MQASTRSRNKPMRQRLVTGQDSDGRRWTTSRWRDIETTTVARGGFRSEVQPRRQHWFLNEKSGFPFRTPAFCSVSRGQRRLGEKEYRAPSVTPGVALRDRTQAAGTLTLGGTGGLQAFRAYPCVATGTGTRQLPSRGAGRASEQPICYGRDIPSVDVPTDFVLNFPPVGNWLSRAVGELDARNHDERRLTLLGPMQIHFVTGHKQSVAAIVCGAFDLNLNGLSLL